MRKKDRINILSQPKQKDQLIIQCVDEHEIIGEERPENEIEERDSLVILSNPKEPLQAEYIDELILEANIRPEN